MAYNDEERQKAYRRRKRRNYRDGRKLRRAKRILKIELLDLERKPGFISSRYKVTGGIAEHVLTVRVYPNERPDEFDCDCGNTSAPCSHVIKWQLTYTPELFKRKKKAQLIVKVQWPTSGDGILVLVYNQAKSIRQQFSCSEELRRFMENKPKVYAAAHVDEQNKLVLDRLVPDQLW